MTDERKTKYHYFLLAFAGAFLILSLLFLVLVSAVRPDTPATRTVETDIGETAAYVPARDDALTVLFVGTDGRNAETFLLARFDPARGSVPIVTFPRDTAVQNLGRTETLEEVYTYGGADYTRGVLEETLGIPIDRYVRMDTASFLIAAATVGTVEYTLDSDIAIRQEGGLPVTLEAGVHLLDGQMASEIIRGGGGDEPGRCNRVSDLTAAIVNQRIDVALSTMVDKIFEKIINLIDTDISYPDYDDRKEAAAFLARLGQDPAVAIDVDGLYDENDRYVLGDTFVALLTQTFV